MYLPIKGCKYLLSLFILFSGCLQVFSNENTVADPEYVYIKRGHLEPRSAEKKDSISTLPLPPGLIEVPVKNFEALRDSVAEIPVKTEEPAVKEPEALPIDTHCELPKDPGQLEEFSREIESVDFVPKGQWIIGLSVSYNQSSQDKYQFLILEGISGDTYSFKISPTVLFTVRTDLALGARFSYARSLTKVSNAEIVLDSETNYEFDHLYRLSHNYYGAALMRNYFSIGRSKRFGFFNEVSLQMGGGQTKLTTGVGDDLTGTYERNFSLNVGITPGLCVFLSNYSALEVNVGLLGFNYTDTKAIKDQIYVSKRNSKSANFRINLFSITFGATFYL